MTRRRVKVVSLMQLAMPVADSYANPTMVVETAHNAAVSAHAYEPLTDAVQRACMCLTVDELLFIRDWIDRTVPVER